MAPTRSPRLRTGVACAVIAAEMVAGVVALVVVSSGSSSDAAGARTSTSRSVPPSGSGPASLSSTSASASGDAQSARLVAWARRALPLSTPLLAGPGVATALRADGFSTVRIAPSVDGARFVFDTPALRAAAAQQPAVARALAGSVPVAQAGSGSGAVLVRQIADVTAKQLAAEARTRRSAETELLANDNLHAATQPRRLLAAGALDLRAAAVLALLASAEPLDLVAIRVDPLEQAAGRPARVVELRATSIDALRSMLSAVAVGYRLSSVTTVAGGVQRLTWPVDVTSGGNS